MLHTPALGQLGEPFPLCFFLFDAGLPRVLNGEHSPGAVQRSLQAGRIVEVAPDNCRATLGEHLGHGAVRLPGQHGHAVLLVQELVGHRAALVAGGSRYENQVFPDLHWSAPTVGPVTAVVWAERRRFLLLARGCHLAPEYVPRRVMCLERAGRRIPREVIDGTRGDHLPLPHNAGVRSGFCDDAVAAYGENAHRDRVVAWERNGPALAVGRRGDRIRHDHAVLGTDHASALPAAGDVGELDAGPLRLYGGGGGGRRVLGTGWCSDDSYSDGRKEQDGTHSQTPSWKRERTTGGLAGG